jgi:hypothetical protein
MDNLYFSFSFSFWENTKMAAKHERNSGLTKQRDA